MADQERFTDRMSDQDALMWNIEKDPVLRSTILAVAFLDQAPDWARLVDRFDRATLLIPRLRQRVVSPPFRLAPPSWSVERDFDLAFHMRRFRVPPPGDRRTVLDMLQPMAAASFDRARPLWECTLLEGLADDGAAIVLKVHHSVTDGVGGMELLLHLIDLERDATDPDDRPAVPAADDTGALSLVRDSVGHTGRRVLGIARRTPATVARGALDAARDPLAAAVGSYITGRSIARTLAPAMRPMSPVMLERGLSRRLDSLDIPIDDLKRAAKAVNGSLNDAFVASVIGGLARYHARHGTQPEQLRMTMPINIRTESDAPAGNQFTPARFPVPATIADPKERMLAVGEIVRGWRAEPALALTGTLAGVLNRLPTVAVTALFGSMLKCCDFLTTNVPGAPVPVYIGGARVERFYAFAPPSGAAVNVALISHCDTCCIGVVTDTAAVPDADVLMECLREGFAEVIAVG
ncbi:MAG TPA: wax ester/triacylglycerol synthase family O-acyltransferase [Acidimicrobiia bacterium]|nr:wax ester/triacylglycerol synthase family O-acyltransferase [Acidimicrobiia bacterium]